MSNVQEACNDSITLRRKSGSRTLSHHFSPVEEFRKFILPWSILIKSMDPGATLPRVQSQPPPSHLAGFMALGKSPKLTVFKALARFEDCWIKSLPLPLFPELPRDIVSLPWQGQSWTGSRNTCSRGSPKFFYRFLMVFNPFLRRPIS